MKVQDITDRRIRPQKLSGAETPHATIEPNTTCNIRCRACYSIEEPEEKPLQQVFDEIDLAMSKRNLDAISLLGGEPSLHPDIVEIVRYVKSRGLVCMLLTNGVRFLYHDDEPLLDALVAAGVDRFLLHIDSGQAHIHDDIEQARERMFSMLDERRVFYGLSLTLYPGEETALPGIMRRYAPHPYFDGVLVTLAMDFKRAFQPASVRRGEPDMGKVVRSLSEDLGVEMSTYLPSSLDDDEVCWAMYFYWINAETGKTFGVSPALSRAMKVLYRGLRGHHFFAETMSPRWTPLSLAATGAAEVSLKPRRVGELARLLRGARVRGAMRFQYVVVQQAPRYNEELGQVQICWQCPDAVIRNGKLTPVCIAGRINPLGERPPTAPSEVVEAIYHHLGESGAD